MSPYRRLTAAAAFAAPLLALLLLWHLVVTAFEVNPRVFPGVAVV